MKVVAFVPIKLNSERVPQKNIRSFSGGKPLIRYILDTLNSVDNIDERYVYCSSPSIAQYQPKGFEVKIRSPHLDLSSTPFNEVLRSFALDIPADVYVLTHATAPFIRKETIEKAVEMVRSGAYDSAITVQRQQEFVWIDGEPANYSIDDIPRTQDLKPFYTETCGLFVYTREQIVEHNRRIGPRTYLLEIDKIEAVDINEEEDFLIADSIHAFLQKRGDLSIRQRP